MTPLERLSALNVDTSRWPVRMLWAVVAFLEET